MFARIKKWKRSFDDMIDFIADLPEREWWVTTNDCTDGGIPITIREKHVKKLLISRICLWVGRGRRARLVKRSWDKHHEIIGTFAPPRATCTNRKVGFYPKRRFK